MPTIKDVEQAWARFQEIGERAEQHHFIHLLLIQSKFEPLYNDLHENWDEHHAEIFIKGLNKVLEPFGY